MRCAPVAETPSLCIALHDVAPATWPACRRLLALIDEVGPAPVTLLVVPDYHHRGRVIDDRDFIRAIEGRLARGDEVAVHGYHHLDEAPNGFSPWQWLKRHVYTRSEGEFAALDEAEAHARLMRGWAMFADELGWPVAGFVAPAWLLGHGARAALARTPFRYTTTLRTMYHLPDWQGVPAPGLVYSAGSAWRRGMSRRWNHWLLAHARRHSLLRIGLHPVDAHHTAVVEDWRRLIALALAERRAVTKGAWMEAACGADLVRC